MLDAFLKVAYSKSKAEQEKLATHNLLKQLPEEYLRKLASGELTKTALLDDKLAGEDASWISQFKGSPLFDQAIQLEQEEIQTDMDRLQKRQMEAEQRRNEDSDSTWVLKDQIKLKKKLLELQLAQSEVTGQLPEPTRGATAPAEAQGAGAVGAEASNPGQAIKEGAAQKIQMAEKMGRDLAHSDFDKEASARSVLLIGDTVGRLLVKTGFAVTEKGHKWDAEKHRLLARQGAERAEHAQEYSAMALKDAPVRLKDVVRFHYDERHGRGDAAARHHEYVAKKHEEGRNAWNPFGGGLTPSSYERGGTSGIESEYGKSVSKKEAALNPEALKGLGHGALNFLKANKGAAIGTAVGAAGGLMHGLERDPMTGERSLTRGLAEGALGAAGGAAVGHGGQHFMNHKGSTQEAFQSAVNAVKGQAQRAGGAVKGALGDTMPNSAGAPTIRKPAADLSKTVASPVGAIAKDRPVSINVAQAPSRGVPPTVHDPKLALKKPAVMNNIPTSAITGAAFGGGQLTPPNVDHFKLSSAPAIGGIIGAAGGLAAGLRKDPKTGKRSVAKGVAGGVLGAGAGVVGQAVLGHGLGYLERKGTNARIDQVLDRARKSPPNFSHLHKKHAPNIDFDRLNEVLKKVRNTDH